MPGTRRVSLGRCLVAAVVGLTMLASGCQAAGGESDNTIITAYGGRTGQFTKNFNPFSPTDSANRGTRGMIYESLLFFNQAKADEVRPWLAKDHSISEDGKAVTFALRQDVTWSDGKRFTSADVAFTFELIKKNPALNQAGLDITSIETPDKYTVRLEFGQSVYRDLWYVAGRTFIVPKHIWSGVDNPAKYQNRDPVGTGGFQLAEFSSRSYLLAKNSDYWQQGKPAIGGVRFLSFNSNSGATRALSAGKIDWASIFIPKIEQVFVSKNPEHNRYTTWDQLVINLTPNLTKAPLDDPAVRRAVSLALNRKKINKLAFAGYNDLPSLVETIVPRHKKYLAPEFEGVTPEYNPKKAVQRLREAGYRRGSDGFFRDDQGRKLSIECLVVSGYTDYISALQIIQENLQKIGIEFSGKEVSRASFASRRAQGKFEMIIDATAGGPGPYYLYNRLLNSNLTAPVGENAESNWARFRSDEVDQLLQKMTGTDDTAAVKQAAYGIQRIFAEKLPYIPLSEKASLVSYSTADVTGWPTPQNPYAISAQYIFPDIGVVALNLKPNTS